ncbi:hypothetical protein ACOSQ4_018908 [Xanthoceras sorbifolium]
MSKKTTGKEDVPKEQFCVFVILPWCNDVVEVKNDNELVNIFSMFREYGCSNYAIQEGVNLHRVKNEKNRLTYKCKGEGCSWRIYASCMIDGLKTLFWMCSRSSNLFEFNDAMAEIGRVNIDARTWLDKINPIHWSRHAFDQSIKCDHVTNNMTESFNSMLGDHRAKTFLQLLEFIRRMVMKRFQKRKEYHYAGRDGVTRRIVEYVHPKLTKTAFSHTYSTMIHPIPDICVWPNLNTTPLIPPPFRTKPGRPKLRMRREPGEKPKEGRSKSVACNKCGQPGHNKRTCRNEPVFRRKKQV